MATYYFRNAGSSASVASNWSTTSGGTGDGAVPTVADTAVLDSSSGSIVIDTAGLTWGNLNFVSYGATSAITNDLYVTGTLTTSGTGASVGAGNVRLSGNLTMSGPLNGTCTLHIGGTGTWSGSSRLGVNTTINTAGTLTVSGGVLFGNSKTLTYTAGTVVTTGSSLVLGSTDDVVTVNANGVTWNNVSNGQNVPVTLTSNLQCQNLTNGFAARYLGQTITINGNLTQVSTSNSNTSTFVMAGTGTVSTASQIGGAFELKIDTAGSITFTSPAIFTGNGNKLTYVSGTITNAGNFDLQLNCIVNGGTRTDSLGGVSGIVPRDLFFISDFANFVHLSDVYCRNLGFSPTSATPSIVMNAPNGSTLYCGGYLSIGGVSSPITGTAKVVCNGEKAGGTTAVFSGHSSAGRYSLSTTFDAPVTVFRRNDILTFHGGSFVFRNKLVSNSNTLIVGSVTSYDGINRLPLRSVVVTAGVTVTLNEFFTGTQLVSCTVTSSTSNNYNVTFTGISQRYAHYVKVTNCTLTQPGRMLVTLAQSSTSRNIGVCFSNQLPSRFPDLSLKEATFGWGGKTNRYPEK